MPLRALMIGSRLHQTRLGVARVPTYAQRHDPSGVPFRTKASELNAPASEICRGIAVLVVALVGERLMWQSHLRIVGLTSRSR